MQATIKLFVSIAVVIILYFFSYQFQIIFAKIGKTISETVGVYSVNREYAIQRYVYLHRKSLISRFYNWINEQLITIGLKRLGVTPFGYCSFWFLVATIVAIVLKFVLAIDLVSMAFLIFILFFVFMISTRVVVAERMEKREADVMDAVDLIIPEVSGGVKNAILRYIDNFSPSLQADFRAFVVNIQDRGYSFSDAMYILADNLGLIFKDFAQKAVYFEDLGEPDMVDIFADITETNRLRRELRYTNGVKFGVLKTSFVLSSIITFGYFGFLMLTDEWSRTFFLQSMPGRVLLVVILLVVFGVLSYITTIKSRSI